MSVFLSAKTFTKPSALFIALALELAKNGKTPLVYSIFFALSYYSVYPTHATSGYV